MPVADIFASGNISLGIPGGSDILLNRRAFSLGYSHKYRQALWVSYILTKEQLQQKQVKRSDKFSSDPAIIKNPVVPQNYNKTGYDRGHLAPAADMTYSVPSMQNSFFMTNISPQIPGCNRGIWKRLENQVRRWAIQEEKLYIITGPIFTQKLSFIDISNFFTKHGNLNSFSENFVFFLAVFVMSAGFIA